MNAISQQANELREINAEQRALEKSGQLHWFHWLIVALSVVLTIVVWQFSKAQLREKTQVRFERDAEQVLSLIIERLQKYEEALWASVATIQSNGGDIDYERWATFATALHIENRYKGINGIGVIHRVELAERESYLKVQQQQRPDFQIYPSHDQNILLPISYIIPVEENIAAVGLDVAHENNRLTAALKARDTATAQITGPIFLVQDAEKTPGFLFYAPFYRDNNDVDLNTRRENFSGLVYAPFVVHKLMQGTLEKARRQVGISIRDGDDYIYDESQGDSHNQSASVGRATNTLPNYEKVIPVYGRDWRITIWDTDHFQAEASNNQPQLILVSGIIIDTLLFLIFYLMNRANRLSLAFAKRLSASYNHRTRELRKTVRRLEASNQELEQFAYIASHDLQEPLRTLSNYSELLNQKLSNSDDRQTKMAAAFISKAAERMRMLVLGLMSYNRIGLTPQLEKVNCNTTLAEVCADLESQISEAKTEIATSELPTIHAYPSEMRMLFQNLISNAIKFRQNDIPNKIKIDCLDRNEHWQFSVCDNGIGIAPENVEKIFQIFRRLHREEEIAGSGIGLASCKKIIDMHGGKIWVTSSDGKGSCFHFTLPKEPNNEH